MMTMNNLMVPAANQKGIVQKALGMSVQSA
jgi:hypothetical protein